MTLIKRNVTTELNGTVKLNETITLNRTISSGANNISHGHKVTNQHGGIGLGLFIGIGGLFMVMLVTISIIVYFSKEENRNKLKPNLLKRLRAASMMGKIKYAYSVRAERYKSKRTQRKRQSSNVTSTSENTANMDTQPNSDHLDSYLNNIESRF